MVEVVSINKEKDEFIGSAFGSNGQLIVVDWEGERSSRNNGGNKKYKVHCTECAKDSELFGDGCFYSSKNRLNKGVLPCGCSSAPRWSEEQCEIRIRRECKELTGLSLLGFKDKYNGTKTKVVLQCNLHNTPIRYDTVTADRMFSKQIRGCPSCYSSGVRTNNSKTEEEIKLSFTGLGVFPIGCKFTKSNRKDNRGYLAYWNYTCPICSNDEYVKEGLCSGVFISHTSNLQKGKLPCRCSPTNRWTKEQREYQINKRIKAENLPYVNVKMRSSKHFEYTCNLHGEKRMNIQNFLGVGNKCSECSVGSKTEAYISFVWDGGIVVAIKFGISNSSIKRCQRQNYLTPFEVELVRVFSFPTELACRNAEKSCKEELQCAILSKQEMFDGWTETTSPLNLDKITEIYHRFGGTQQGGNSES